MAIDLASERKTRRKGDAEATFGFHDLPLELIDHGRNPRVDMASTDMKGLTASIEKDGVLTPIRVRPDGERFTIVFGHRRFEAAKAAKLEAIPAIVTAPADPDVFVQSLVENIQREDLNPLEEAQAYKAILEETKLTQGELAKRVGKSQPHISNMLRILKMPDDIQHKVSTGELTAAHAKNIASLPPAKQTEMAQKVIDKGMTTADLERELSYERQQKEEAANVVKMIEKEADEAEDLFRRHSLKKRDSFILDATPRVIDLLVERGWKKITAFNWNDHTPDPDWDCDCTAAVSAGGLGMVRVALWGEKVNPVCINREHKLEARRKDEEARQAIADEKRKVYEKAARKVARSITDRTVGKGALNLDGQRLALYCLLRGGDTYYGSSQGFDSLSERHGGQPTSSDNYGSGWETIQGLSEADLGEELARVIIKIAFRNALFETSNYPLRPDAPVRQWFVDQFGIDKKLVWGDTEPPTVEEVKASEQEAYAEALMNGQGDPVEYLQKFVDPHAFISIEYNDDGTPPTYEDTGELVPEDEWLCQECGQTQGAHHAAYDAPTEAMGLVEAAAEPEVTGTEPEVPDVPVTDTEGQAEIEVVPA